MDRRGFVKLAVLAACAPGAALAAHPGAEAEEPFSISWADTAKVPRRFRRQRVSYKGGEPPGTIIVDTSSKYLYLVEPGGKAMRYGIGVGRQGFSWSGRAVIRRKAKWPRWTPPAEMVARDSYAAEWADGMPGGPTNPLGARALYLFQGNTDTLYRIHGTFQPGSIGRAVSSGCIRLLNADVVDLYDRVQIGAQVVVLQRRLDTVASEERRKDPTPPPVVRRNFNLTR